jgi:predicted enzyme related to lactoylglutathione lyase
MGRYVHFEHFVDDPQKAIDFYQRVFGWSAQEWTGMPYWIVTTGPDEKPGINGGFSASPPPDGQRVVNTLEVDDIDDAIKRSREAGAVVIMEKQAIPGVGWMAYLKDPTGVVFGVYITDEAAA